MAEPKWTDPQKDAIESRGRDVLVSAAAGSGKTAVLTERLFRTLSEDRVDLSRVLVVTFTVKAAEELRARVRERLEQAVASSPDDAFLASQLQAIGTAKISTIDSYCKSLIDERFSSLGLPAGTSIIQEQEERALWEKILPPLLDETLKKDPESGKYLSSLGDTTERRVNALLDLYSALLRYPDPVGKLASCAEDFGKAAENGLAGSVWWELLKDRFSAIVDHFHPFMEQAVSDCDADPALDRARGGAYRAILSTLEKISAALKTGKPEALWDAVLSFEDVSFCGIKFEKDARTALHAELRDKFRKTIKEWRTDFFAKHRSENAKSEFADCKKAAKALLAVLRPFRERELEEKKRRRVLSFNDMEQYARILLIGEDGEPTDAAREISDRLDAVFIDEYQDTSPIQDAVFSAIAGKGRRFLVGDVKQCIYKFRSADPRIFQSYRKREDFRNVMLADNFRSEQRIVDFVNAVFDRIFSFGDLDYDPALDALKCHPNTGSLLPVRGVSVEAGGEAAFIAAEIEKIRREEAEKEKEPSIAVLFRSSKNTDGEKIAELAQRLRAKGIPCSAPTDSVFFKKKEVL
ncbi:MAG: UvrD-helicase domain-containing protein, partial [Clostridia bacterium]|nr:UvrD-helicase domain-containing protein [Clostridia bacterium]